MLIGWDGSQVAARAINDAIPLIEGADMLVVMTVDHGGTDVDDGADPADVVSHLAQHGLQATALRQGLQEGTIADALLDHATTTQADLLVMGGYGHSRLHEVVVGGTTRAVLRGMTLPVLMSH